MPTQGRVRQIVKSNTQNPKGWEYYELEIAEVMDITTGRVSQIKKSAISKLRNKIKEASI